MQQSIRRYFHNVRTGHVRLFWIFAFLLALVTSSLTIWADSKIESKAPAAVSDAAKADKPVSFKPDTEVRVFAPSSNEWVQTTYKQVKPGNEFIYDNKLYRVVVSIVPNVDASKPFEADQPYQESIYKRPQASDVVQVLDKDMQFVAHEKLSTLQFGTKIRFQGRVYDVGLKDKETATSPEPASTIQPSPEPGITVQPIEITKSAWQHVIDRHTKGGKENAGKSTFNSGENIQALIKYAESANPVLEANGYLKREVDAGRIIGYDGRTGKRTSMFRVITTQSGKLVTAYPVLR